MARLTNVVGTFIVGEKLLVSDSAEADGLLENSGNADATVASTVNILTRSFSETRSVFGDDADSGQDFTADIVLTAKTDTDLFQNDSTDAASGDENDHIILEEDNSTLLGLSLIHI